MLSDLRESGCIGNENNNINKIYKSWDQNNILKNEKDNFNFKGIKPTFELLFNNKVKISLTANHKVLTNDGWMRVSEITRTSLLYCLIKKIENKNEFRYQPIKRVKYLGLKPVYDKTVPLLHNYIKNGTILHNSIEQDADVVIMLYREEYYNEKGFNPHLTEFIVSKHRNGPIGTAKLIFNPTTTTFSNI
jgi:replicative DNA helicase